MLASDLDRTLIHPVATLPDELRDRALVAEVYEGRPITVVSPATLEALTALADRDAFVAVTTRSRAQLERVRPVWELASRSWAICANGATLLHHGEPDREWEAVVEDVCGAAAPLGEAREALHAAFGPADPEGWLQRVRDCDARFIYAVCDAARLPPGLAGDAEAAMARLGWTAILHGRKLYALPAGLTKVACVAHLRERTGARLVLAAGDSLLDATLLEAADRAWCPADAELVALDAVPRGVEVTRGRHLLAAEEIARAAVGALVAQGP